MMFACLLKLVQAFDTQTAFIYPNMMLMFLALIAALMAKSPIFGTDVWKSICTVVDIFFPLAKIDKAMQTNALQTFALATVFMGM